MHYSAITIKKQTFAVQGLLRPAALAILLGGSGLSGGVFTPAYAQSYSFSNVVIEGNQTVDAATILSYAGIKRGQSLSAGALNDAYQRIVNSGLFETVELTPNGGTLKITVTEMPMINVVDLQGNKRIKDEALKGLIQSKGRAVYNPSTAEADAAAIAEAYRIEGRLAASVQPKIIRRSNNRVDLVFEISEGKTVEVERLSIVGNRAYSDRRLRQVLETKQAGLLRSIIGNDTFQTERLEVDKQMLRDFYMSRGYVDVQILDASGELAAERDASFVTISVREGQQFKIGEITTVSAVDEVDAAEFIAVQRLKPGTVYSPALIENNLARMESLALKKGLNFVKIEPVINRNDRDQTLDIEFVISRGERVFVERIDIEGNTTTMDQVIRRQFRTAEGDPFSPREIRQAAERVRALGFFGNANVDAAPGSDEEQVVLNVDVEEAPTGSLNIGGSYSVNSGAGLTLGFTEKNFLGRGQSIGVNIVTGSDSIDSSISFVEPALLGRDLKLKFGALYNTTNNSNANFDTVKIGISAGLEFPVSQRGRLELRYAISQDAIKNVDAIDAAAVPADTSESSSLLHAEEAVGKPIASAIGYAYTYDSKIGGLNPTSRVLLRFSQDFAGLGGDAKYIKTKALALAETKVLQEEVTLRAVFEGGVVASMGGYNTRVTDRFFGNSEIRGFKPNGIGPRDLSVTNKDALGGNVFAVARFEADFPLGLPEEYGITGGVFLDVGSVWGLDDNLGGAIDDSMKIRSTVGFGLDWTTPIGPLRFNFTKALRKESYDQDQSFDLTISTKF